MCYTFQRRTGGILFLLIHKNSLIAKGLNSGKIDSAVLGIYIVLAFNLLQMDNGTTVTMLLQIIQRIQSCVLYPEYIRLLYYILGSTWSKRTSSGYWSWSFLNSKSWL